MHNYYPFGLQHKGYNDLTLQEFNYKQFQGQEYTEDLSLNIHEWKYRVSDPSIGRFWQVDPLAEKYKYQTVYQFSSNQPIHAPELEGLESMHDLTWNEPGLNSINASAAERKQYNETVVDTGVKGLPLAIAIATPIPGDEALVGGLLFKTGVAALDATSQMAANGKVDAYGVLMNVVPVIGPVAKEATDAAIDVNIGSEGVEVVTSFYSSTGGDKEASEVLIDFVFGIFTTNVNSKVSVKTGESPILNTISEGAVTGGKNVGTKVTKDIIRDNE
ncbi:RHS repeat-associated core domain-containing protein [Robertkochia marina]|nr:RHS repeat-associated core domain-containing protein [Robertkochia marina]